MRILIDADGCPVVDYAIALAQEFQLECIILCDTAHYFNREGARTIVLSQGADSVDFALVNMVRANDIVVTQDYGVAAMALGKNAYAIHQSGKWFTDENIDQMLMERHLAKKARRGSSKNHLKGPRKRTVEDDERFAESFEKLLGKTDAKDGEGRQLLL